MSNPLERRSFLSRMGLGLGAILIQPFSFLSKNQQSSMNATLIQKIRPLGFQWETQDPFLFCVHHEDYFPKGNAQ
jgi:hypothetical protein